MIVSYGFNDTAHRFGKIAKDLKMELVGDFTIGGVALVSDGFTYRVAVGYDQNNGDLTVCGDFLGREPIYYFCEGDTTQKTLFNLKPPRLLIASALKCFYGLPLSEVHRLPQGTSLKYSKGKLTLDTYYTVPREIVEVSDAEAIEKTRTLLTNAVQRTINDFGGKPCVFLSGGVDSTVICALAKQARPISGIEAFTFSVGDKKGDLQYARLAAEHFKMRLHEVIVTQEEVMAHLDEIIALNEDSNWTQITSAVGQYFLAREASKLGFNVALCGDLSDEIYASYPQVERWSWRDEQYIDARTKLINKAWINCVRAVKVLGAFGMSYADPFTDRQFVEFASNTPARFKEGRLDGKRVNKFLLRSAFADLIPTEIATRAKGCQGQVTHVDEFMEEHKEAIKERYNDMFNKEGIIQNVNIR